MMSLSSPDWGGGSAGPVRRRVGFLFLLPRGRPGLPFFAEPDGQQDGART